MDADRMVVSVRGRATLLVMPDVATLQLALRAVGSDAPMAVHTVAQALSSLTAELTARGGGPWTVGGPDRSLAWVASSVSTNPERDWDERRQHAETGRIEAEVQVRILVREFDHLGPLQALLAAEPAARLHHVGWGVDDDNPGWADVRASAVTVALERGRQYAAALGGQVVAIEQLADGGLLADTSVGVAHSAGMTMSMESGGSVEVPRLDPVPQQLSATIDARLVAAGIRLG